MTDAVKAAARLQRKSASGRNPRRSFVCPTGGFIRRLVGRLNFAPTVSSWPWRTALLTGFGPEQTMIVLRMLIECLCGDGITCRVSVAAERQISVQDLLRGPPDLAVRTAAFKGLAAKRYMPLAIAAVSTPPGVGVVFHST